MTGKYLAMLKSKIGGTPLPHELTELTKAPSVSCVSDRGTPVLRNYDLEERAAMAAEGGVPEVYVDAFARMQVHPPSMMTVHRWQTAINHAGMFLDEWGPTAEGLRWSPDELFGAGGLVWQIGGHGVVTLDSECAVLTNGRRIPRRAARRRA